MITATGADAQIQFEDVGVAAGVSNTRMESWGVSWGNLDNDGDDDLIFFPTTSPDPFLRNDGGFFTNTKSTMWSGTMPHDGERMGVFFDSNNDGKLDIFYPSLYSSILYRQKPDGTFGGDGNYTELACGAEGFFAHLADVHPNPGLELICAPVQGHNLYPGSVHSFSASGEAIDVTSTVPAVNFVNDAATGDFDGDLRPDIFVVKTSRPSDAVQTNDFRIETQMFTSGLAKKTTGFKTTGKLNVLVDTSVGSCSTQGCPSAVYIGANGYNPPALQFTLDPANPENWGLHTANTEGTKIGYDPSTGVWQILQEGGSSSKPGSYKYTFVSVSSSQKITGLQFTGSTPADLPRMPTLLRNTAAGWVDATVTSGLNKAVLCTGVVAGDFDNDMDEDLFLACTGGAKNIANILYQNLGNGSFQAVANAGGAAGAVGAAYAGGTGAGTSENANVVDYDVDGFLDLFVYNGNNMRPQYYGGPNQLFRNAGNGNHWIELDLEGVASNRDGIGATVLVTAGGRTQYREVNGGYHRWSQNGRRVHVGLGSNTNAGIVIRWPDGSTDTHANVAANALYRATQGGAITPLIVAANPKPDFCGEPSFSSKVDRGTFLWKDCTGSGSWQLRVTGGGTPQRIDYAGTIVSAGGVSALTPVNIESTDTLDTSTQPDALKYKLLIYNNGMDGFNVQVSPDACFTPTAPKTLPVYLGTNRILLNTTTLNMTTGGACP